ncbi:PREDICTED: beta-glucuronidase-like [Ceratosolen solmsi marchali]|uniref:Beta-glucuronidase n=1 Tax=Ceratosolen solmsi marchali TaxID=326594 RepID=A0AAJ7E3F3_9HYME|nr:PREDICTED: beta-glucuronidase-like [Ceratosolen solmsi marchali]
MFGKYFGNVKDDCALGIKYQGLLYPRESEYREVKSLDGLWDFVVPPLEDVQKGHREQWYTDSLSKHKNVLQMPVPSSYNDITTSNDLRDHVGPVWYEKTFFAPTSWRNERIFLRFGSVNYLAEVWLNSDLVINHEIGHLPFEAEVTSYLILGGKNRLTVSVDNTLFNTSIPQGKIVDLGSNNRMAKLQTYNFDFFNYAGIHRPVLLHTKPQIFIEDISVTTELVDDIGIVHYNIEIVGLEETDTSVCAVNLLDGDNEYSFKDSHLGVQGTLQVKSPKLWWPRYMSENPGYLYTLEVTLSVPNNSKTDIYRLPIGIRSIKWTSTSFLINNKPIYFRGFGRHEDSIIRGRGLDLVTVARDYELLKWIGANAYRTSHYPYSDEVLDLADKLGFLVIGECPSVDTEHYSSSLLKKHKRSILELIRRDKNRPSVVMWSVANEPRVQYRDTTSYFKEIVYYTRILDSTRPITVAIAQSPQEDKIGQYLDVISFNRYNAWYLNPGRLDTITKHIVSEAQAWYQKYKKPVLLSEYGADTLPGLHELPAFIWSEEYQAELISNHFKAFDQLKAQGFFIGEFIWNFADFRTAQSYTRVGGNKKGVFTRDRQPKLIAHYIRKRYCALGAEHDKIELPNDLEYYISSHYAL